MDITTYTDWRWNRLFHHFNYKATTTTLGSCIIMSFTILHNSSSSFSSNGVFSLNFAIHASRSAIIFSPDRDNERTIYVRSVVMNHNYQVRLLHRPVLQDHALVESNYIINKRGSDLKCHQHKCQIDPEVRFNSFRRVDRMKTTIIP